MVLFDSVPALAHSQVRVEEVQGFQLVKQVKLRILGHPHADIAGRTFVDLVLKFGDPISEFIYHRSHRDNLMLRVQV